MCRIRFTPNLRDALGHVFDGNVVFYPGNTGPMAGWYWRDGGHMSQVERDCLEELYWAHLTEIGEPPKCRRDGNPVLLSAEGVSRLAEWDARVAGIDASLRVLDGAA